MRPAPKAPSCDSRRAACACRSDRPAARCPRTSSGVVATARRYRSMGPASSANARMTRGSDGIAIELLLEQRNLFLRGVHRAVTGLLVARLRRIAEKHAETHRV